MPKDLVTEYLESVVAPRLDNLLAIGKIVAQHSKNEIDAEESMRLITNELLEENK